MTRSSRAVRLSLLATLAGVPVLATACGRAATDPGRPGVPVVGSWRYVAQQTSPAPADLQGTLAVGEQSGARIAGALDVVETDARGLQRRLGGAMAGRTADSTTLDFDVAIGAGVRRHVGRVRGDSLTGSWIEQPVAGGAPVASGSFRAARQR
ncbi:hypothetical protein [Roseisolibacter agri]|nr:hypothetical protein [Roseisolibacter agri]